jgi:nucleotide-binding universal stress UspA family protein
MYRRAEGSYGHSPRDLCLLTCCRQVSSVVDIAPRRTGIRTRKDGEMPSNITHPGVVVGVDGSPFATTAVRWAAQEAAMRNVPLTIVHVVATQGLVWPGAPVPAELYRRNEEDARYIIAEAKKVAEDSIPDRGHLQIDDELFFGAPVPTLVDLSKEAQIIVVGCRGQGALQRALLGSVSSVLVHHAHCPVAVIHGEVPVSPQPARMPVLVGIDGSPSSEVATAIAFDEASWRGVELVALHAWSDADMTTVPSTETSGLLSAAEKTLAERLAGFQEHYPDVTVRRLVVFDHPARHLLDESESAQLVVVGSHGRGGFTGMLLGSVSTLVVHTARIPVIVARQH